MGAAPHAKHMIAFRPKSMAGSPILLGTDDTLDSGRVDIYFSAGSREKWTQSGYRSCDDGVERNCELWRVRWDFATGLAGSTATKVRSKSDVGYSSADPVSITMPAVSPSGDVVAYKTQAYHTDDVFQTGGNFDVLTAVPGSGGGWGGDVHQMFVATPPAWGGGVGWPAFLGDDVLLTAADYDVGLGQAITPSSTHHWFQGIPGGFPASFKTIYQTPLGWYNGGRRALGVATSVTGVATLYDHLGIDEPNEAISTAERHYSVASDPHAHENVLYDGVDRGARIVSYGDHHGQDDRVPGTPRVIDAAYPGFSLFGAYTEEAELPRNVSKGGGGCHHPTWNLAGDTFQCSHQQTGIKVEGAPAIARRTLHGFRWSSTKELWVPWPLAAGELFPQSRDLTGMTAKQWYDALPNSLIASSEGLAGVLPGPLTKGDVPSAPLCQLYTWKYGAFCGSDGYAVAMLSCSNQDWATSEWGVNPEDTEKTDTVSHFGHLISRIVLIRLSDGHHWDLTSLVARRLGNTESADPLDKNNIFGIFPTCGPLRESQALNAGGITIFTGAVFRFADAAAGHVDEDNLYA